MTNGMYEIKSLADIGFNEDIPEPYATLEENAMTKAQTIFDRFGLDCFGEDTGLEVQALDNAPGVLSARYAGPQKSAQDNMTKLLNELEGKNDRKARFRTVIALILDGKKYYFEGKVEGQILTERRGEDGFGYDPLFFYAPLQKTFAELSIEEKNNISHRGLAINQLVDFLTKI